MKKFLCVSLLGLTFLTTTVSCQNATDNKGQTEVQNTPKTTVADLATAEFQNKLAADNTALLLDVRTPQEFASGHLQNATAINFYDTDFKEKVSKLDKTKAVYVYCAAGGRSSKAAKIIQELGFKGVYNLLGGFTGWAAANLPTIK
jgi:rhodanese-related sulfurtransferase